LQTLLVELRYKAQRSSTNKQIEKTKEKVSILPFRGRVGLMGAWVPLHNHNSSSRSTTTAPAPAPQPVL
jgi:hypothetical protein